MYSIDTHLHQAGQVSGQEAPPKSLPVPLGVQRARPCQEHKGLHQGWSQDSSDHG